MRRLNPRARRALRTGHEPGASPLGAAASQGRRRRKPASQGNAFAARREFLFVLCRKSGSTRPRQQGNWQAGQALPLIYGDVGPALLLHRRRHLQGPGQENDLEDSRRREVAPARVAHVAEKGGAAEGIVRAMMAMARTGRVIRRKDFAVAGEIAKTHKILERIGRLTFAARRRSSMHPRGRRGTGLGPRAAVFPASTTAQGSRPRPAHRPGGRDLQQDEKAMLEKIGRGLGIAEVETGNKL